MMIRFLLPIIAPGPPTEADRKNKSTMKKFLEVLVDEDGKFHFSTEEEFVTEEEFAAKDGASQIVQMEKCDKRLRQMVNDLTDYMWRTKDQGIPQAIRLIAIAEILGGAQPYESAEMFWSMMMFHTIPELEHDAAAIKKRYGFDDHAVNRPLVGGSIFGGSEIMQFPIPQPCGKIMN